MKQVKRRATNLSGTEISDMPDGEFEATICKDTRWALEKNGRLQGAPYHRDERIEESVRNEKCCD